MAYSSNPRDKKPRKRLSENKRLELEREREFRRRYSQNRDIHFNLFEFVVEPDAANMAAYTIVKTFLETGACQYNPTVIYGPSKSGKTHLLKSLAQGLRKNFPSRNVLYLSGEEYYHRFAYAVRTHSYQKFRNLCRTCHYFILDDFHLLQNKMKSQEDLRHLLDFFERKGVAVIVGSRLPLDNQLAANPKFCAPLVNRLQKGASLQLKPIGVATAMQFCAERAKAYQITAEEETFRVLWDTFPDDFGKFKAMIHRMFKLVSTTPSRKLALPMLDSVRARCQNRRSEVINLDKVLKTVADYYGLKSPDVLRQQRGPQSLTAPRYLAIGLAKTLLQMKPQELRETFGNRSESSIRYALKSLGKDAKLQGILKSLHQQITSPIVGPPHTMQPADDALALAPLIPPLTANEAGTPMVAASDEPPTVAVECEPPRTLATPKVSPAIAVDIPSAKSLLADLPTDPESVQQRARELVDGLRAAGIDVEALFATRLPKAPAARPQPEVRQPLTPATRPSSPTLPPQQEWPSEPTLTPEEQKAIDELEPPQLVSYWPPDEEWPSEPTLTPEEQKAIDELEPPQPEPPENEPTQQQTVTAQPTNKAPGKPHLPAITSVPTIAPSVAPPHVDTPVTQMQDICVQTPTNTQTQAAAQAQVQPQANDASVADGGKDLPPAPDSVVPAAENKAPVKAKKSSEYLFDDEVVARVAAHRRTYSWDESDEKLKWKRLRILKCIIDENKRTRHLEYPKMDWELELEELIKPREPVPQCLGQLFWEWPENPEAPISMGRLEKLPDPPSKQEKGTGNEGSAKTPAAPLTTPWLAEATQKGQAKTDAAAAPAGESYPRMPGAASSWTMPSTDEPYVPPAHLQARHIKPPVEEPIGKQTTGSGQTNQGKPEQHLLLRPKIGSVLSNLPDLPTQHWKPVQKRRRPLTTEETLPPAMREAIRKKEEEQARQEELQRQEALKRQQLAAQQAQQPRDLPDGMRRAMQMYEALHGVDGQPVTAANNAAPTAAAAPASPTTPAPAPESAQPSALSIPEQSCLGNPLWSGMRRAMEMYWQVHAKLPADDKKG